MWSQRRCSPRTSITTRNGPRQSQSRSAGRSGLTDVASFAPVPPDWPQSARDRMIGTQFQVWTEYIPDGRALEYMIFPRACALAEVAWAGGPVPLGAAATAGGQPPLPDRIAAHLRRLDAAGLEYRPLDGPRPWQQGGSGPRRHRPGYPVQDVAVHLGQLAGGDGGEPCRRAGAARRSS